MSESNVSRGPSWSMPDDLKRLEKSEAAVKWRHLVSAIDGLAEGMVGILKKHATDRIDALEKEVASLKAASTKTLADSYKGTWQPSAFDPYERGAAVTFDGSLWLARTTTRTKPGASEDWQMIVKRGRDGKDATP